MVIVVSFADPDVLVSTTGLDGDPRIKLLLASLIPHTARYATTPSSGRKVPDPATTPLISSALGTPAAVTVPLIDASFLIPSAVLKYRFPDCFKNRIRVPEMGVNVPENTDQVVAYLATDVPY